MEGWMKEKYMDMRIDTPTLESVKKTLDREGESHKAGCTEGRM